MAALQFYKPDDVFDANPAKFNANNIRHYFLLILHGINVTPTVNCINMRTGFKNSRINFFIEPNEILYTNDLQLLYEHTNRPAHHDTGFYQYIKNTLNDKIDTDFIYSDEMGTACLPPMRFHTNDSDTPEMKNIIGLYHFYYFVDDTYNVADDTSFYMNKKFYGWDNFETETYSTIYRKIATYIKETKANPTNELESTVVNTITDNNVDIGFFTCRQLVDEYAAEYANLSYHKGIVKKIPPGVYIPKEEPPVSAAYVSNQGHDEVLLINYDFNLNDKIHSWVGALAGVTHQGCALNVLTFFDILSQTDAREKAICLNLTGTSIFKMIDYINQVYPSNYGVIRCGLNDALNTILAYFTLVTNRDNEAKSAIYSALTYGNFHEYVENLSSVFTRQYIILKMYDVNVSKTDNTKYNEVGHTVAIAVFNGEIYFIDPQISWYTKSNNADELKATIVEKYPQFNYCDLIIHNIGEFQPFMLTAELPFEFRARPETLSFGGGKKKRRFTRKRRR